MGQTLNVGKGEELGVLKGDLSLRKIFVPSCRVRNFHSIACVSSFMSSMGGTVAPLVGNDLTQLGCLFFDRTKQVGHKTTHIIAAVIAKPASSFRSTGSDPIKQSRHQLIES